jgi:hypothetical protein
VGITCSLSCCKDWREKFHPTLVEIHNENGCPFVARLDEIIQLNFPCDTSKGGMRAEGNFIEGNFILDTNPLLCATVLTDHLAG